MKPYGRAWGRTRLRILQRDRYRCHWCGARANTVDHLVPVAEGGNSDDRNLVAACTPCNLGRGGKLGAERAATRRAEPGRVTHGAIRIEVEGGRAWPS